MLTLDLVMVIYKDTTQKAMFNTESEKISDTDLNPDDACDSENTL